jgi:uncharacterized protein YdhG (YjbR/CyaY superfamily)
MIGNPWRDTFNSWLRIALMDKQKLTYTTIEEYISSCSKEIQPKLRELHKNIKALAPTAEEKISYGMPAYMLNGPLVYFGVHTHHIGFYPTGSGVEAFKKELKDYKFSKGAIQFPLDQPLPLELVKRIVKFRVEHNSRKGKRT